MAWLILLFMSMQCRKASEMSCLGQTTEKSAEMQLVHGYTVRCACVFVSLIHVGILTSAR